MTAAKGGIRRHFRRIQMPPVLEIQKGLVISRNKPAASLNL